MTQLQIRTECTLHLNAFGCMRKGCLGSWKSKKHQTFHCLPRISLVPITTQKIKKEWTACPHDITEDRERLHVPLTSQRIKREGLPVPMTSQKINRERLHVPMTSQKIKRERETACHHDITEDKERLPVPRHHRR